MNAVASPSALDDLLADPAFYQDPYPVYARLREHAPVHRSEVWGQWIVTRHADVVRCLRDATTFSSAGYEQRFLDPLLRTMGGELPALQAHHRTGVLSTTDPPQHTRLRRLISGRFTPRVVSALAPEVERLAGRLLAPHLAGGRLDLVADYAYPLPALVIGRLLDLPEDLGDQVVDWSRAITDLVGTGQPEPDRARAAESALTGLREVLQPLITARRRRPGEDLLSLLAGPDAEGDRLDDDELIATCVVLLFAGHETTANLIGNAVVALLTHPAQLRAVRRDPSLVPAVVEETLRYDGSVQRIRRVATRDLELGGARIGAGDLVMAFIGSANRDPLVHAEPDRFDPARTGPPHVGFGHGIHFCLGAALTRLEAPIALRVLLAATTRLRLPEGTVVRRRSNLTFRGPVALPLLVDPSPCGQAVAP